MAGRALLIGSQTYGLRGCDADVQHVAGLLAGRGFDHLDVRTGPEATYHRLVEAFESLVDATRPGDAVVVYYSGHGARVVRPDHAAQVAAGRSPYHRFLVPFDLGAEGEFRGLFAEEVSEFQRRLTAVTPNVTTVLDCCHAGYLARDATVRPKALSPKGFPLTGIDRRLARLPAGPAPGGWDTNPYAVRVVAAQEEQSAYEADTPSGPRGLLTEALVTVLDGLGDRPVPWSVIGDLVRRRVSDVVSEQRPEVEGPSTLLPFTTRHAPRREGLPVASRDGRPVIEAAALLGVTVGDRFRVESPAGALGEAEVVEVRDGVARLDLDAATPPDAYAVPRHATVRRPVAVRVNGTPGAALRDRIAAAPRLAVTDGPAFASVVDDGGLRVLDDVGARMRTNPLPVEGVVDLLDLLARAGALAELGSGEADTLLSDPVAVSFAVVHGDRRAERPRYGARLRLEDRVSVRLRNLGERAVYFWLFDVGVSARTALVTNAASRGTRLAPRGDPDDTRTVWGEHGAPLAWPPDVPRDGPRLETFVIVLADRPQDLRPLEATRAAATPALSRLDTLLDAARQGTREVPVEAGSRESLRYRVERVQFLLAPD